MTTKHMPEFNLGSSRDNAAFCLRIGAHTYYVNQGVVVAYCGPGAPSGIRISSVYSSDGRHMREMGCYHFDVVSESDFVTAASLPVGVVTFATGV